MSTNRTNLTLSSLVTMLAGSAAGGTTCRGVDLDDLHAETQAIAGGSDRDAKRALCSARAVLLTLNRYGDLVARLAGSEGAAVVERERGRWQELLDSTLVRLAKGEPVVIHRDR